MSLVFLFIEYAPVEANETSRKIKLPFAAFGLGKNNLEVVKTPVNVP